MTGRTRRIMRLDELSTLEPNEDALMNEGVVSKETVVLRRWGSSIQKFGFINGVDKCKLATVQRF